MSAGRPTRTLTKVEFEHLLQRAAERDVYREPRLFTLPELVEAGAGDRHRSEQRGGGLRRISAGGGQAAASGAPATDRLPRPPDQTRGRLAVAGAARSVPQLRGGVRHRCPGGDARCSGLRPRIPAVRAAVFRGAGGAGRLSLAPGGHDLRLRAAPVSGRQRGAVADERWQHEELPADRRPGPRPAGQRRREHPGRRRDLPLRRPRPRHQDSRPDGRLHPSPNAPGWSTQIESWLGR